MHLYLGCDVVLDWEKGSLSLLQRSYTERVLKIYCFKNATPARTPLSPGMQLTKLDCPAVLDPALQRRYRGIVGHLSFLVQCTLPDLSFAYAELCSKPWPATHGAGGACPTLPTGHDGQGSHLE